MSSSYIVEPQEGSKKDDTLILMVNDHGVISVDQDTLQNLILNQSNATVSVVRLGQTENDAAEGNITLTVDPPAFVPSETNATNSTPDSSALVDPFMEMDPEQLERLETALQSEEAKQILGENVTAMLDMLTVEERQNSIRYSIELDHCYTSRFSPSQPKPVDPLPDMDESMCIDLNKSTTQTPVLLPVSSANVNNTSITPIKQKVTPTPPKIVKQPVSVGSRPRRASTAMQPITTTPKSIASTNVRTIQTLNSMQENKVNSKEEEEAEDDELFSSSESESEESDSDSDFGARPSRRGVRARGGRRGLTTRGGSMAASRRRGSNKQMDSEQVRRLDLEMAAAVNAMKSPEKEEKLEKQSPNKLKKPLKTFGGKKKDDVVATPPTPVSEAPPIETNVLQTTNQVKANLISANMYKGDMILTKPGQDRNNQKVVFVQKQVMMNPNDIKTLGIKKQVMIPKSKLITTPSKVPMPKETKVPSSPVVVKGTITAVHPPITVRQNVTPMETSIEPTPSPVQSQKTTVSPAIVKTKPVEIKKDKKKIETTSESPVKPIVESPKNVETKTPFAPKKIVKKEHRKSDTHVVEALGPALFSTPDIIRRVGSTESKAPEHHIATTLATPSMAISNTSISTPLATTTVNTSTISPSSTSTPSINASVSSMNVSNILDEPMETSANDSANDSLTTKLEADASMLTDTLEDVKMDSKTSIAELLQPALDTTSNSTPSKDMPSTMENTSNSKHVSESGIEGDDHLLATLGMEAAKQLPNDEELLAEALLLQETLGVDLDHSGLVDPTPEIPESILSTPIIEPTPSVITPKEEPAPVITPTVPPVLTPKTEPAVKKDAKEPIQVIRRGGRVITLPPIEAPATRSKRLQAKAETQQVKVEKKPHSHQHQQQPKVEPLIIKTERATRTPTHVSLKKQDMIYDIDDDDEEEEEMDDANSDSEDDPNRLWCICRQPHNNRFMICCDMCQDWFHGKCVNVTKAMGEQMEKQGIEWVCPNCSKKKNEESKPKATPKRQRNSVDSTSNEHNRTPSVSNAPTLGDTKATPNAGKSTSTSTGVTHCVVCKKEARKSSIYCSDACILAHAEVTSTKPSPAPPTKTLKADTPKLKQDVRIIVYEKKTGKVLTGSDAPTASNLKTWLKEHPTYEVVKSNNLNTLQLGGKTVPAIQAQGIKTNKLLEGKSPGQAKMVFSKIPGSKQTVLASSAKKGAFLSEVSPTRATASPQHRPKQVTTATPGKTPVAHLKQATIKTSLQQQQSQQQQQHRQQQQSHHNQHQHQHTPQKPMATSTPKASVVKKPLEAKPSTSQQKPQIQQKHQHQQKPQPQQQQKPQQQQQQQQQPKPQQQQQQQKPQQPQQQQQQQPQAVTKTPPPKKPDTEPIRLAVRKTLAEYLTTRIKEAKDLSLTEDEILELALQIELEMFKFFKDTGAKYKSKYRSLLFNIKDPKNLTLFRKIADRSLTPNALVKLSAEEMASQELAEWREKENKHQLEMIKKNELELMAQAKSIVVKTHKGEQIIENDGSIDKVDPETPVQDIVTALSGDAISSTVEEDNKEKDEDIKSKSLDEEKKKKEKERDREKRRGRSRDRSIKDSSKRDRSSSKSRHRHSKDRDRSRDKKSKKDSKHKDRDRTREHKSRDHDKKKDKKDKHKRSRSHSRSHSKSRHKDHKDKHKKEEEKKKDSIKTDLTAATPDKPIEDRLWRHIEDETTTNTLEDNESDVSDREPSSTVTIKTPDINEELDSKEIIEPKVNEGPKGTVTVWRGAVYMADVAKFSVTAQNVSGNCKELLQDLPDHFDVVGRISPFTVWDYISKMKKNASKEILIIRLTAINDEEKIPYITLYSYLNNRNRFGVIGKTSQYIKDFYIMPFSNSSTLPSVLLPFDGPGLEENRQHLLLGIIVGHSRKKRVAPMPPALTPVPMKMAKKEQQPSERSYTPPPMSLSGKDESMTPPSSPRPVAQIRMVTQEVKQSFSVISKIVPELSSKITLESSSSSDKMQLDDDDEPYSPGEPVDIALDDEDALSSSSSLKMPQAAADTTATSPIKSSTELQRKMEELSRQIEEEKQQIISITLAAEQSISSSFLGDASTTLPGLGLDPPNTGEVVEAYSPTDAGSFTPPPPGISKLTQPILEKVSNITIPPNLQEILANVKRQENSKVDPYLPSKPSATFLTSVNSTMYQNQDKYSPTYSKTSNANRLSSEVQSSPRKETKSTLSSLSDFDLVKKAEEELAALAAANAASATTSTTTVPPLSTVVPPGVSPVSNDPAPSGTTFDSPHR